MTRWWNGLRAGAVFGITALGVEMATTDLFTIQNRITPGLGLLLGQIGIAVPLGALLGLVTAPLLGRRRLWHTLAVAALWTAVVVSVAPAEASFRVMAATAPVLAIVVVLIGRWMRGRWPRVPYVLGWGLMAVVMAGPTAYIRATTPPLRPPPAQHSAAVDSPDVVVVVLDTVRADHVSAYGYPRPTTPNFDTLASEGALFLEATAPSTWSLPSHASLFTGLFPSVHGAHDEHRFLDAGPPTMASTFTDAGYDTRCFTANAWISDNLGLTRGFLWQDEAWRAGNAGRAFTSLLRLVDRLGFGVEDKGGGQVAANFEAWAASRPAHDRPAFAFLNFIEAHFPYHQLPDAYLRRFTPLDPGALRTLSLQLFAAQFGGTPPDPQAVAEPAIAMYDAGVLYADALLGRVVEALRRRGSLDRTVLVVLADHGELLGERGEFGHGLALFEAVTHVPLLVRYPPRIPAGRRIAVPVSTVGVFATALELSGVTSSARLDVASLVPVVGGQPGGVPVVSERYANTTIGGRHMLAGGGDPVMAADERYRSYRVGSLKLVEAAKQHAHFLFDLAADPTETHDLAAARPDDVTRLEDELATWGQMLGLPALDAPVGTGAGAPALDPAARERLKALGYVQ